MSTYGKRLLALFKNETAQNNLNTYGNIWGKIETDFDRTFKLLGDWTIRFRKRSSANFMGRFGGGWNWKLGLQWGGSTCIVSLFVMDITIHKKEAPEEIP